VRKSGKKKKLTGKRKSVRFFSQKKQNKSLFCLLILEFPHTAGVFIFENHC